MSLRQISILSSLDSILLYLLNKVFAPYQTLAYWPTMSVIRARFCPWGCLHATVCRFSNTNWCDTNFSLRRRYSVTKKASTVQEMQTPQLLKRPSTTLAVRELLQIQQILLQRILIIHRRMQQQDGSPVILARLLFPIFSTFCTPSSANKLPIWVSWICSTPKKVI